MTDAAKKIREFVVQTFMFGEGGDTLADADSLLDRGIIDSTGILEVVAFLEGDFGVKVADDEIVPDNFDSIAKLAAYVAKKKG